MRRKMCKKVPKKDSCQYWDDCPTDILLNIFPMLPIQSLIVCMFVNSTWRKHVEYLVQIKNKWKMLVETLTFSCELLTCRTRSCDWQQVYHNYILWYSADKATVKLEQVTNINDVQRLRIYQDNLIIVTASEVLHYTPNTLLKIKSQDTICIDYYENDNVVVTVTDEDNFLDIHIFKKPTSYCHCDMGDYFLGTIADVLCYKFHGNHCYFMNKNSFYKCALSGHMDVHFIARFYNTPGPKLTMQIDIFNNEIYVLFKNGTMWWNDSVRRLFRKMNHMTKFNIETVGQKYFHSYSLAIEDKPTTFGCCSLAGSDRGQVETSLYIERSYCNDSNVVLHKIRNVSCMLQHGDLLFLGFTDGTVRIVSPRASQDAILNFNLKDLIEDLTDLAVLSIEIYEEDGHHVYVATSTQVFKLSVNHENCDLMWRDEVFDRCLFPGSGFLTV